MQATTQAGYSKLEMMPLEYMGEMDARKAPARVVSFANVRIFRLEDVGDRSPGALLLFGLCLESSVRD